MAAPNQKPSPSNQSVVIQQQQQENEKQQKTTTTSSEPTSDAVVVAAAAAAAAAVDAADTTADAVGTPTLKAPPTQQKQQPSPVVVAETASAPQGMLKDPPPTEATAKIPTAASSAAGVPVPATTITTNVPTYESSESSAVYQMAKQLLNDGDFEEAMALLGQQIEATQSTLAELLSSSAVVVVSPPNDLSDDKFCEFHTSMAPLYYLYGTTLLYSLEEANEGGQQQQQMSSSSSSSFGGGTTTSNEAMSMTVAGSMAEQAIAAAQAAQDQEAAGTAAGFAAAAAGPATSSSGLGQSQQQQQGDENVDDMMIAWENLELARTILERILTMGTIHSSIDEDESASSSRMDKYRLDLAQTMLRVADLQRLNGRYEEAVQDYASCLELRQKVLVDDPWNRKIADAQYNLGLTYLTSSSELQKEKNVATSNGDDGTTAATPSPSAPSAVHPVRLSKEHCQKGIAMYLDCAKTFSGILAQLCGTDPMSIVRESTGEELEKAASSTAPTGGLKTTGLYSDDDGADSSNKLASEASLQLSIWRSNISTMLQTKTPADEETAATIFDLQQLLDEIQETIDEAERSHEGVKQASQIKVRAQAAAAAAGAASGDGDVPFEEPSADGVTTTIGFGSAGATASAAAASQPTMMVVKKKKKRPPTQDAVTAVNQAEESQKRSKTE